MAKKEATKKKPAKPRNYPPWKEMIATAIVMLKERTGSSAQAISKYIESNYPVPQDQLKVQLRLALKRGVQKDELIKVKASYRLNPTDRAKVSKALVKAGKLEKKPRKTTSEGAKDAPKEASPQKERGRSKSPKKSTEKKASASPKKSKSPAKKKAKTTKKSAEKKESSPKQEASPKKAGAKKKASSNKKSPKPKKLKS